MIAVAFLFDFAFTVTVAIGASWWYNRRRYKLADDHLRLLKEACALLERIDAVNQVSGYGFTQALEDRISTLLGEYHNLKEMTS